MTDEALEGISASPGFVIEPDPIGNIGWTPLHRACIETCLPKCSASPHCQLKCVGALTTRRRSSLQTGSDIKNFNSNNPRKHIKIECQAYRSGYYLKNTSLLNVAAEGSRARRRWPGQSRISQDAYHWAQPRRDHTACGDPSTPCLRARTPIWRVACILVKLEHLSDSPHRTAKDLQDRDACQR